MNLLYYPFNRKPNPNLINNAARVFYFRAHSAKWRHIVPTFNGDFL